jgi:hypothetical protein
VYRQQEIDGDHCHVGKAVLLLGALCRGTASNQDHFLSNTVPALAIENHRAKKRRSAKPLLVHMANWPCGLGRTWLWAQALELPRSSSMVL